MRGVVIDYATALEGELARARRRIRELEAEMADCGKREEQREARVQDRIACLIEQGQRRRVEGARILGEN